MREVGLSRVFRLFAMEHVIDFSANLAGCSSVIILAASGEFAFSTRFVGPKLLFDLGATNFDMSYFLFLVEKVDDTFKEG